MFEARALCCYEQVWFCTKNQNPRTQKYCEKVVCLTQWTWKMALIFHLRSPSSFALASPVLALCARKDMQWESVLLLESATQNHALSDCKLLLVTAPRNLRKTCR